jgi:hypothetical protein
VNHVGVAVAATQPGGSVERMVHVEVSESLTIGEGKMASSTGSKHLLVSFGVRSGGPERYQPLLVSIDDGSAQDRAVAGFVVRADPGITEGFYCSTRRLCCRFPKVGRDKCCSNDESFDDEYDDDHGCNASGSVHGRYSHSKSRCWM